MCQTSLPCKSNQSKRDTKLKKTPGHLATWQHVQNVYSIFLDPGETETKSDGLQQRMRDTRSGLEKYTAKQHLNLDKNCSHLLKRNWFFFNRIPLLACTWRNYRPGERVDKSPAICSLC
ncbi:hypothetical protein PoB_000314300 [Plakobranchus ocellatus]|uniref:Uncharacterized protein n=1 Tax=Plakobranchus ocellatus TaxID=259542 RepID=A0AAV3Y1X5_9GAST|nr:hypothetical protein PoB_000314300 [Plakobranchus ocellatus]